MKLILRSCFIGFVCIYALPARGAGVEWIRQVGTAETDYGRAVSADALGNVFVGGKTNGNLAAPNAGLSDAFLSRYDVAGNLQWVQQFGSSRDQEVLGASTDGLGNVYISGVTYDAIGGPVAGSFDMFVAKYASAGSLLWARQLGTGPGDEGVGISADALGNVYVAGLTYGNLAGTNAGLTDVFLAKYDASGTLQWTRQFGTSNYDDGLSVSADGLGGVYIAGRTQGNLDGTNAGNTDAFLRKYDAAGTVLWTRQLGTTGFDESTSVSADALGNVYISGETEGSLGGPNTGSYDAFVSKYNSSGALQWTRQTGTSQFDDSNGVETDGLGNVYLLGNTNGSLSGPNAGNTDTFVRKYNAAGTLLWTRQFGTSSTDYSMGISSDSLGNLFVSGITWGSLGGPNAGVEDAFVAKLADPVPEPSSLVLTCIFAMATCTRRRRPVCT
jgi:hypothetical protein